MSNVKLIKMALSLIVNVDLLVGFIYSPCKLFGNLVKFFACAGNGSVKESACLQDETESEMNMRRILL